MKKVLLICLSLFLLSCSKSDNKIWDSNKMVSLRPEAGVKSSFEGTLSAKEIVKQTSEIYFWHSDYDFPVGRAFSDNQRDFVNNRLLMWGEDVIDPNHGLVHFFIEATDLVFVKIEKGIIIDTLAYIPNTTLRAAETIIKAAYAAEDYDTCYNTFDNAWKFIPITGQQWRELKKQGKQ